MKICLGQLNISWEDKEDNKLKVDSLLKNAAINEAKFIIFPEMTLTGFSMNTNLIAETSNYGSCETIDWFSNKAKEYNLNIAFGHVEKGFKKSLNKLSIVSNNGILLSSYTKIHPFSFGEESIFYQGGCDFIFTNIDDIIFGSSICYDLRFPELFQILSTNCHCIINIANWPKQRIHHWLTLLEARAIENQCYIIGVNRTGEGNNLIYTGDSVVFDPSGNKLLHLTSDDSLGFFELDKDLVLSTQNNFKLKNDRKEWLYSKSYSNNY